jgi:hypothetical protein
LISSLQPTRYSVYQLQRLRTCSTQVQQNLTIADSNGGNW